MPDEASRPIEVLPRWHKGESLGSEKLNGAVDAINRITQGIALPVQVDRPVTSSLPTACRVIVTDADTALSGLQEIDGITLVAGNYVLRTADDDKDGVYEAASGAWFRRGKLSASHGRDNSAIYKKGTLISVYDGDSAPLLYMVTVDNTLSEV